MSNKRYYGKRFSDYGTEGGHSSLVRAMPYLPDTDKQMLARKLHRQGMTVKEMMPHFPEYTSEAGLRGFLRKNGIRPRHEGRGGPRVITEEAKQKRSESMKAFWDSHPNGHQNVWSIEDKAKMKVSFPNWHEEARKLREEGVALIEIAKKFNVTVSRVSQVTSARWEIYAARDKESWKKRKAAPAQKEENMPDRTFEKFKSKNPQETREGVLIRCHSCNKSDLFMKPGRINQVHAARTFRERGWTVGGGPRADTCPECSDRQRIQQRNKAKVEEARQPQAFAVEKVKEAPIMEAPIMPEVAEPPVIKSEDTLTPMSRADKRIIISKLQDVYVDEIVGYKDDWDDDKVAADMGVPVQWVAEVREDSFGPNINPIKKQAAMTAEQVKVVEELAKAVQQAKQDVEEALANCDDKTKIFDARMDAFEKAYAELHNSVSIAKAA